jgi:hypothetical protein
VGRVKPETNAAVMLQCIRKARFARYCCAALDHDLYIISLAAVMARG